MLRTSSKHGKEEEDSLNIINQIASDALDKDPWIFLKAFCLVALVIELAMHI